MKKLIAALMLILAPALAAAQSVKTDSNAPIDIASDQLEVLQAQNKAIFSGNVIAKQGGITMRANTMTVYYDNSGGGAGGQGITRIDAEGGVVFTTAEETAQGDKAVYTVATDSIDLMGNVVLTREENVLKGSALNYNLTTGRSILSAGGTGRVRGLFVPNKSGQ